MILQDPVAVIANSMRIRAAVIAAARATGDPINVIWAMRAAALWERGEAPHISELDAFGHECRISTRGAIDALRTHGLEWVAAVIPVTPVDGIGRHRD